MHLVQRAWELPEQAGRSLSQWDGAELARQRGREAVVAASSPQPVQRLLADQRLKPWRSHGWLHPRTPRDAAVAAHVRAVGARLTRLLAEQAVVRSRDARTALPPRPRRVATRPAPPGRPSQVAPEDQRAGATHLVAACATRSGHVDGGTTRRTRQVKSLTRLERLDPPLPASVTTSHLLADTGSVQHGKRVHAWLAPHPRVVAHFPPVHGAGMNPVEHWFGRLRRKRLRSPTCAALPARQPASLQFISEWNEIAQPFRWTVRSFDKILANVEADLSCSAASLQEAA